MELQAQVTQTATWPWRFTLEAPRFDPREELLPDSSLTSLAASLSGHGSVEQGAISGKVLINDEPLLIEPLRFMRNGNDVTVDTILRISRANGGAIHIGGDVDLGRDPVTAKVVATWNDIVVPAAWVGQELFTRGELNLQGSAAGLHGTRHTRARTAGPRRRHRARCARHAATRRARSSSISRKQPGDSQRAVGSTCNRSSPGT